MAEYLNKELFLQSMGLLGDETKYGNRDGEHQNRSYSTWMGYEIMGSVDDSIVEEDIVSVVRCKDCKSWKYDEKKLCGICEKLIMYRPDYFWCMYGERRGGE